VLYVYGRPGSDPRKIYGFRFSSNAARHRTYGINGQFFGSGNTAIAGFFPDGVFETHYLAGSRLFLQERGDDLLCARPAAPPPPSFDRHSFTPFEIVAKDRVQLLG
jgi:hypothetical protein